MKRPNSLLKHGMIVWKGKDPRKGYCVYTYDEMRLWEQKRSICWDDNIEIFEKLGFETGPHWTVQGQLRGFYSVRGVRHHGPYESLEEIEQYQISPVANMILNDGINNKNMKMFLTMDEDE